ncbi:hypothetical protein [Dactylosporangium darangshiense]|uniref:Uncharacterized protein n=1 Tax=Dactylosporangium darangshiense TaxID=579108 RepID=A0ABP8D5Q6_9ACTN
MATPHPSATPAPSATPTPGQTQPQPVNTEGTVGTAPPGATAAAIALGEAALLLSRATPLVGGVLVPGASAGSVAA